MPRRLKNRCDEHIKFAFIFKNKTDEKSFLKTKKYELVFLTDSNKCCFEKFYDVESHEKQYVMNRLKTITDRFLGYKIDKNTEVCCDYDVEARNTVLAEFLYMMHRAIGFHMTRVKQTYVLNRLLQKHGKFDSKVDLQKLVTKHKAEYDNNIRKVMWIYELMYDNLVEREICPWINNAMLVSMSGLSKRDRRARKYMLMVLYYMVLKKVSRLQIRSWKENQA